MTVDSEDAWARGEFRAATDASAAALAERSGGEPFRDGVRPIEAARALHEHGRRCWHLARFDEAHRCLQRAYDLRASTLGAGHPDTLATLERLAALAEYTGDIDLARARFDEVITGLRAADVPATRVAVAQRNLAAALRNSGDTDAAAALIADDVRPVLAQLPDAHPDHVDLLKGEATLASWQDPARAFQPSRLAARAAIACWGETHPFTAGAQLTLAKSQLARGRDVDAYARLELVTAVFARAYGPHPLLAIAYDAMSHCRQEQRGRCRDNARRAYEMYRAVYPTPMAYGFGERYLDLLLVDYDLMKAEPLASDLQTIAPAELYRVALRLANAYADLGLRDDAMRWLARGRTAPVPAEHRDEIDLWIRELDAQLA